MLVTGWFCIETAYLSSKSTLCQSTLGLKPEVETFKVNIKRTALLQIKVYEIVDTFQSKSWPLLPDKKIKRKTSHLHIITVEFMCIIYVVFLHSYKSYIL